MSNFVKKKLLNFLFLSYLPDENNLPCIYTPTKDYSVRQYVGSYNY